MRTSVPACCARSSPGCPRERAIARRAQLKRALATLTLEKQVLKLRAKRRVPSGHKATLRARAVPCLGAAASTVVLKHHKKVIRRKKLNDGCKAKFHVTIGKSRRFKAVVRADARQLGGKSDSVKVRIEH